MTAPQALSLGVVATSAKENERRLPIHPEHFRRLAPEVRARITLEHGYGERFGHTDASLADQVAGFATREELLATSDVVLLPKPQLADVEALHDGQVLWGWPHCVQDTALTQAAIDRKLTLVAFEAMNHWTRDGTVGLHVFHKNNELAGYCSVIHALTLGGITGSYGRKLTAVVIGFGATARGAVTALSASGIHDVRVLTIRDVAAVASPIHSVRIHRFEHDPEAPALSQVFTDAGKVPLAPFLAESDIVVNCTLQDTAAPLTYLRTEDLDAFRPGSLIVDVSCDEEMGFSWARPTTFDDPMFNVGNHIGYYAVDHTPSYLWSSATWENSEALLPFVPTVLAGPEAWAADETIRRSIEIQDGQIVNPAILAFQGRTDAGVLIS
ncbi:MULTISPECIES: N(5)-(carboxyethyl)ornithine synthase [unclassified Nocardioides]|uniref:N(5)-(carboxyethyl)ornithine synthase n=1 Tax=unclassified Nocardioides TaxID=2615069 RepID=UPI000701C375|nr:MULTISPECIES: N(5)-(carboxyethyl)ornithine synthase [unclassified Nocardioides]KQY64200.1 alanine dehydrogenase [Nocardioides sp. Root140]KQZ70120.1 alanine dehydrogenase [Nocardioides sp. Root151]KRF16217.1 alanine dehydrogenase [Nocardioides sp. Soil796]